MTPNLDGTRLAAIRLLRIYEHSLDAVIVADHRGTVIGLNASARHLTGLQGPHLYLRVSDLVVDAHDHDVDLTACALASLSWSGDALLVHTETKEKIPVSTSAYVVDDGTDRPVVVSMHRDVRDQVRREEVLQSSLVSSAYRVAEQRMLAELSQMALNGPLDELLIAATEATASLLGADGALITRANSAPATLETIAHTGSTIPFGSTPPALDTLPGFALTTDTTVVCTDPEAEKRFCTANLVEHQVAAAVAVPITGPGRPWGVLTLTGSIATRLGTNELAMLAAVSDVLAAAIRRVDIESELRFRSLRDPLTGLPNRVLAYDRLDTALERAAGRSTSVAVMLIDLDDFKSINDSLGHDAGDTALVTLASRLARAARPGDTVARLGGDEFVAICENMPSQEECRRLAAAFSDAVRAPIVLETTTLRITTSIGIAMGEANISGSELIRRADVAMYRAKDGGADCTTVFDTDDKDQALRQLILSTELRGALDQDRLTLKYQPIFDISSGAITAVEALARWTHPTLGEVSPTTFVNVAERTGLINSLGLWALKTACEQAATWQSISDIGMRVNVSALQLRQPGFVDELAAVLADTRLPVRKLGIEITETVWLADTAQVRNTLTELHEMGVSILLDDLGSGHSSVNYLSRYPVIEAFKIDQTYIQAMPGRRPEAIVTAIVSLAHAFDVSVVGEGVETQDQLDRLRASGCDQVQGYLLAEPATASEMTALLLERSAG